MWEVILQILMILACSFYIMTVKWKIYSRGTQPCPLSCRGLTETFKSSIVSCNEIQAIFHAEIVTNTGQIFISDSVLLIWRGRCFILGVFLLNVPFWSMYWDCKDMWLMKCSLFQCAVLYITMLIASLSGCSTCAWDPVDTWLQVLLRQVCITSTWIKTCWKLLSVGTVWHVKMVPWLICASADLTPVGSVIVSLVAYH